MLQYCIYQLGYAIVNALPLRAAYGLAVWLSDVKYACSPRDRRAVIDNMRVVCDGDEARARRCAREMFRNFGRYLVDFFRMDGLSAEAIGRMVRFERFGEIARAIEEHRGVIGLTAHLGNWELAGVAIALRGVPVTAIALQHLHPKVNELFMARRRRHGVNIVWVGGAFKPCIRALRNGAMVGVLGDRNFSDHGVPVQFLGRPTALPRGPALLCVMSGVPMVPCFMIRRPDGTFDFVFDDPIVPQPDADREREIVRITEAYARVIERFVRAYPEQWCMFRRFWREETRVERLRHHSGV